MSLFGKGCPKRCIFGEEVWAAALCMGKAGTPVGHFCDGGSHSVPTHFKVELMLASVCSSRTQGRDFGFLIGPHASMCVGEALASRRIN